jgi:hypothetical protein
MNVLLPQFKYTGLWVSALRIWEVVPLVLTGYKKRSTDHQLAFCVKVNRHFENHHKSRGSYGVDVSQRYCDS